MSLILSFSKTLARKSAPVARMTVARFADATPASTDDDVVIGSITDSIEWWYVFFSVSILMFKYFLS